MLHSELVHLWQWESGRLRQLYSGWKPKQSGNPFISCHVWCLPFLLVLWWTGTYSIALLSLYVHRIMDASDFLWSLNFVMLFSIPLLTSLWWFARSQYKEHCLSCHHHNHCKNCHKPGCSFCIRHGMRSSLSTCRASYWTSIAMIMLLLLQMLKCVRIFIPVVLILLAGDVETNPGPGNDFSTYMSTLPESVHPLLEMQLDWDHEGLDRDLNRIADVMLDWEGMLAALLGLTDVDIHGINESDPNPSLQRRAALRRWKSNQGLGATYKNLLEVFVKAGHSQCAEALCDVLRTRGARESDDEQPLYKSKEEQRKKYRECVPGRAPKRGTAEFEFLEEFCSKVEVILQTVNENEYKAATTVLEKPGDMFDRAVVFPKNGVVLGMFAEKKTALIQTDVGTEARDFIAEAIETFPRACYVIGVGVCYAFEREKYKFGDVLVSEKICDLANMKWDSQGGVGDRGERVDVVESLQKIFCRNKVHNPKFKVSAKRTSKVYSGTFISHPSLIDNKELRDKLHNAIPAAIGGEMEGGKLLQVQFKRNIKGIIVIKGVCHYADGKKSKEWQFISALAALNYTKCKLLNEQSLIDEELPPQASALPDQPPLSPTAEYKPDDFINEELTKALKDGEVEQFGLDSILVGLGGAGKTCFLHRILGEDLPVQRSSTSCTRAPVRTMITVDGDKMMRVEGDDYLRKVVEMAMAVGMINADSKDMVDDADSKGVVDNANGEGVVDNADSKGMDKDIKQTDGMDRNKTDGVDVNTAAGDSSPLQNSLSKVEKEMHKNANNLDEDSCKRVLQLRWNRLTDSGGQSEFLEVLPIFIHNITVCIFIIKLNEKLDSFPMIPFYNEGNPVGKDSKSTYSQEQIVRRFMRALISQHGVMENLKFLFIGTHRDLKEQCEESIEQKNTKLKGIFQSFKIDDQVHYYDDENVIFPINAMDPTEEEVIRMVRGKVVEFSNVDPIPIPIKWFQMELELLQLVQDGKPVLLESQCRDLVPTLDDHSFKAALRYLHRIKHIFYYERSEKSLVVADTNVVQKCLKEVVKYAFDRRGEPQWRKFRKFGILSEKWLAEICPEIQDAFSQDGLSQDDLWQLFISLGIMCELGSTEYLMPFMLKAEENVNFNPGTSKVGKVSPMVVEFKKYPMQGMYCGLVCYLITEKKWKLLQDDGSPVHLTRNSIHFGIPDVVGTVTFNDPLSTFFTLTYDGPMPEKSCPLIRVDIMTGIKEVSKKLHYNKASIRTPEITFLCPCKKTTHSAKMSDGYLTCPDSEEFEEITDKHKPWIGDGSSDRMEPDSAEIKHPKEEAIEVNVDTAVGDQRCKQEATTFQDLPLMKLNESDFLDVLRSVLDSLDIWNDLGLELGLKISELNVIERDKSTSKDCMKAMLLAWLRGRGSDPSWQTLCTALRKELVGRTDIAKLIESSHQVSNEV